MTRLDANSIDTPRGNERRFRARVQRGVFELLVVVGLVIVGLGIIRFAMLPELPTAPVEAQR